MAGLSPLSMPLSMGENIRMSGTSRRSTSRGSRRRRESQSSGTAPAAVIENEYAAPDLHDLRNRGRSRADGGAPQRRTRTWHTRPKSPGIRWHKDYSAQQARQGRVFVIDYVRSDLTREGMRKVAAQELDSPRQLEKLYSNPERCEDAVLRLFHVQNCDWGTEFLLKKYFAPYDYFGRDFSRYVGYKMPERRGGRVILRGKTWETMHEPKRNLIKTAFGLDYFKLYKVADPDNLKAGTQKGKVMELNCFDDRNEHPICGYEAYGQRLSCYIQQREDAPESLEDEKDGAPATPGSKHEHDHELDNGNVVLIIEHSQNNSIEDTLISARQKWESRWRRLPFYLAYEAEAAEDDQQLALQCTKLILKDLWRANADNWERFLDVAGTHVAILEDKIYAFPADESRADEIWTNSSNWLRTERALLAHVDTISAAQNNLKDLADDPTTEENVWLETNIGDYQRLTTRVEEDLVKPTTNLSDLMYVTSNEILYIISIVSYMSIVVHVRLITAIVLRPNN